MYTSFGPENPSFHSTCMYNDYGEKSSRLRLCRYKERVWRPDCHFLHENDKFRVGCWLHHWQQLSDELDDSVPDCTYADSCGSLPSQEIGDVISSTVNVDKLRQDTSTQAAQIQASLEKLSGLQHQLDDLEGRVATFNKVRVHASNAVVNGDVDQRFIEQEGCHSQKVVEVETRFETSEPLTMDSMRDQLFDMVERKMRDDFQKLVLGAMEAALTPLAMDFEQKMLALKRRCSLVDEVWRNVRLSVCRLVCVIWVHSCACRPLCVSLPPYKLDEYCTGVGCMRGLVSALLSTFFFFLRFVL